jgi:hypothetical protein
MSVGENGVSNTILPGKWGMSALTNRTGLLRFHKQPMAGKRPQCQAIEKNLLNFYRNCVYSHDCFRVLITDDDFGNFLIEETTLARN